MILAHKEYPACSEDECQDTTCSDETKLEEDVVDEVCGEDVDHWASIMMQVEMQIRNEI
jgi:hypothetical protein